jgi:hypothetical protein
MEGGRIFRTCNRRIPTLARSRARSTAGDGYRFATAHATIPQRCAVRYRKRRRSSKTRVLSSRSRSQRIKWSNHFLFSAAIETPYCCLASTFSAPATHSHSSCVPLKRASTYRPVRILEAGSQTGPKNRPMHVLRNARGMRVCGRRAECAGKTAIRGFDCG